uniref:WAT1-related protein n=1 Tax=Brassica campestris TaxID=3711 RepID=M4D3Y7_BRACM
MGKVEEYKPVMAMIGLQLCYAGVTLSSRATLVHGTSPRVFILYRQALATISIFPFLYFSRRKSRISSLDLKSFSLIFMVSLIGITINQNLYFEGLYLASSSMGSAMGRSALPNETHLYLYFHNMTLYAGEALSPHRWQLLDIYTPRWLNWDMEERFGVF